MEWYYLSMNRPPRDPQDLDPARDAEPTEAYPQRSPEGLSKALVSSSRTALSVETGGLALPVLVQAAGPRAEERFLEFFTAEIRNPNTRAAYARAAGRFLAWCKEVGLELGDIHPRAVATYVELLGRERSPQTVKQHLAAIRRLLDYLVTGQVLATNPASAVRGPRHVVGRGKTPVLFEEDARKVLGAIPTDSVVGLRDRALLSAMIYSFARVGAVIRLKVKDFYVQGTRSWLVLHEKGGKFQKVPAHHKAAAALERYLEGAGIRDQGASPLFRTARGKSGELTDRPMRRQDVGAMVKRRCRAAGLPQEISCHSFRATGITDYLANGGTLEVAARIAGHASTRTTQLYDRRSEEVSRGEIERIRI